MSEDKKLVQNFLELSDEEFEKEFGKWENLPEVDRVYFVEEVEKELS
jgi:hypothetical protein